MKIVWQVDTEDVAKVKAFVEQYQDDPFVKDRIAARRTPASASGPGPDSGVGTASRRISDERR